MTKTLRKLSWSLFLAAAVVLTSASVVQAQESDLLVTKSGPVQSAADTDVSYTVDVTNLGPDDAATVSLTDAIPTGMTFVSSTQDSGPAFSCTAPNPGDTVGSISCTLATLTAGSTASFTFVFHIPPATAPGTFFTNTANVSSPTDPNSENDSATAVTSTPPPAQGDMFVTKTGPTGAGPDTDVTYTISIGNAGPDAAANVSLNDTLNPLTFVSITQNSGPAMTCTNPGAGSTGLVSCTVASFAAGASATFTLVAHVPPGTPSGSVISNTATVSASNDPDTDNNSSSSLLTVSTSDVGIVKTGPANATAGTNLSYTITVSNGGPDTAFDVTMDDPLPPNTTLFSFTQNSGPVAGCTFPPVGTNGTVSCNFAALANGASAQFTLVIEAGNTTTVTNTATVTASGADGNPGNNSSTAVTTVTPSSDLSVTKSGPATVDAGTTVTYTVTVANAGPSDADNVSLADTLPANTTFVSETQNSGPAFSCTTPGVGAAGTITCTRATFAAGSTAVFSITLQVAPSAADGSSIANTATVSSTTADPNGGDNSATSTATVAASADLSVVKSGPAAAVPGANLTYLVTVTNNGPSDAANVTLTDVLPANTTFVSETQNSGPTFVCVTPAVGATGTITCTIASFLTGATAQFSFTLQVTPATPNGTSIANTATVSATTADPNNGNNSSTTSATVTTADLAVVKTGPSSVVAGSNATYVVTVTNNGPADAANVTLTDILPPNTTFVSETQDSGPAFACTTPAFDTAGTITCTIATLPTGTSAAFTIVLHVSPQATGTVANTTTVTSPSDPSGGNNASTTTAPISAAPAGVPTLSPLALALMALALVGIALFVRT